MSEINTADGVRIQIDESTFESRQKVNALRELVGPDRFQELAREHGPKFPDGPRSEWPAEEKAKYLRIHGVDSYFGR